MFDYFRGKVVSLTAIRLVLEVGGVGYSFDIPVSTYDKLPRRGDAQVFAQLHVREDAHRLFGFATVDERELFNLLQKVNGIGPSVALNILSRATVGDICEAIAGENIRFLTSLKGVGPKTAQRLVTELKEKAMTMRSGVPATGPGEPPRLDDDAVQALQVLGYAPKAALGAVQRAFEEKTFGAVGDLVRAALKHL